MVPQVRVLYAAVWGVIAAPLLVLVGLALALGAAIFCTGWGVGYIVLAARPSESPAPAPAGPLGRPDPRKPRSEPESPRARPF